MLPTQGRGCLTFNLLTISQTVLLRYPPQGPKLMDRWTDGQSENSIPPTNRVSVGGLAGGGGRAGDMKIPLSFPSLFVLRFYGPVTPMGSCRAQSVYLTTRLLGRLSPLSGSPVLCTFFRQKLTTAFLNQRKRENDRRKYFMINFQERMLPTMVGIEPTTSWSPVGRRIQLSHRGHLSQVSGQIGLRKLCRPDATKGFKIWLAKHVCFRKVVVFWCTHQARFYCMFLQNNKKTISMFW